ncbi:MAG: hypothetical protein ACM31O_00055 [Bacteroidota bacterium]
MNEKKESGYFPLPQRKFCVSPNHSFPTALYIPPGQGYRHVCPECGHETVAYGSMVSLGEFVC